MPVFEQHERHEILVRADCDRTWAALGALTLADMPGVALLLGLRALPKVISGGRRSGGETRRPVLEILEREGFVPIHDEPGVSRLYGLIGPFWKLAGNTPVPIADGEEFIAFDRPGNAKVAIDFRLDPTAVGTRLSTETRIKTTDAASREKFRRYWFVVRPGSNLVRVLWLRAVKRRAERPTV